MRAWDAEREARRVELVAILESESFAGFVAEYVAFAETEGLAAVPVAPHTPGLVRTRMPATAWNAYQAVRAFDDGFSGADLATLHELRIAGKWLRYTLEFFREAAEPEATPLIRSVVTLQDHLGAQRDLDVAATLAREFVTRSQPLSSQEVRSIERFVHHLDEGVEQSRRALGPIWRTLVAPAYRRRLGRGLARL
jgi:CHAD domain-containing protein